MTIEQGSGDSGVGRMKGRKRRRSRPPPERLRSFAMSRKRRDRCSVRRRPSAIARKSEGQVPFIRTSRRVSLGRPALISKAQYGRDSGSRTGLPYVCPSHTRSSQAPGSERLPIWTVNSPIATRAENCKCLFCLIALFLQFFPLAANHPNRLSLQKKGEAPYFLSVSRYLTRQSRRRAFHLHSQASKSFICPVSFWSMRKIVSRRH